MKENKINVDLIVPSITEKYNIFLPINKTIGETILILINSLKELDDSFYDNGSYVLLDVLSNKIYDNELVIVDSDIKNGDILALI